MQFRLFRISFSLHARKILSAFLVCCSGALHAQNDSVDVTFYYRSSGTPSVVYLAGEFNAWADNHSGVISDSRFAMTYDAAIGQWTRTERLRVGGIDPLPYPNAVPGAYQYKFNENGTSSGWLPDPLNPRTNARDHNNSVLYVQDPTIHTLLPNSRSGLVETNSPEIRATIFPAIGSSIDTARFILTLDDTVHYTGLGGFYNAASRYFVFIPPVPLLNGSHRIILTAACTGHNSVSDSAEFMIQAGFVRFLTQSNDRHLRSTHRIEGTVQDTSMSGASITHNGVPTPVEVNSGFFSRFFDLQEGENIFYAYAEDSTGALQAAGPVVITYQADHAPKPVILTSTAGEKIQMRVEGNDPDGDALTWEWSADSLNPAPLVFQEYGTVIVIDRPSLPGDYFMNLSAGDAEGYQGSCRAVFHLDAAGGITPGTLNSPPYWAESAVLYEIFMPAFTAEGTFASARQKLDWIEELGANVIWLMPVYENGESINELNAGYNVTDFYSIHPQLGSMDDFEAFLQDAHARGIKVILDSTPNHVSGAHEWIQDIALFKEYSLNRPLIETRILGNDRGLGQYQTLEDGYALFSHYDGWGLANLNYQNIETVHAMMEMLTWWLTEKGIDGYRMDVYWGPQNRYGQNAWWRPFREEIKRIKPEAFILGETDGTGAGSEVNYADGGGAADAAYDWSLFSQIRSTLGGGSIDDLEARVRNFSPNLNYNHYTGVHSRYLRFMENHDETRIAALYPAEKTGAGAILLMTMPGIPMLYAGQEVGEISRRGRIDWGRPGWEFFHTLYKRLIAIRKKFPALTSAQIKRLNSSHSQVYTFLRPYTDQNVFVAINFSSGDASITLNLNDDGLLLNTDSLLSDKLYYLSDVLHNTVSSVMKHNLQAFSTTIPPWSGKIWVLADSAFSMDTGIAPEKGASPDFFMLFPNYPNPFNGSTTIAFSVPGPDVQAIHAAVYNILGKRMRTLCDGPLPTGRHTMEWDGTDDLGLLVASGIYIVKIRCGAHTVQRKMLVLR